MDNGFGKLNMTNLIFFNQPDILFTPSQDVTFPLSEDEKKCIEIMKEELVSHNALGISAVQVGYHYNMFFINYNDNIQLIINPKILKSKGWINADEGCLSYPTLYIETKRRKEIEVEYLDEEQNIINETISDFRGIIFQHEYDHLQGRSFIEHATPASKIYYKQYLNHLRK